MGKAASFCRWRKKWAARVPPDANTLLWVTDHCLRSRNLVNVIVAGKQPQPRWLDMEAAILHCQAGVSIWEWASTGRDAPPDVVLACCGDVPALEVLAAVEILRTHLPELKIRVVNIIDLMRLQPQEQGYQRRIDRIRKAFVKGEDRS